MTPALLFSLVTLSPFCLAPLAPAPVLGDPELSVTVRQEVVQFEVTGPSQPFLGVVLGSLSYQTSQYLVDLPPLLTDGVLLGYGIGGPREGVRLQFATSLLPAGVRLFAQGVTLTDGTLQSSEVMRFAIDR